MAKTTWTLVVGICLSAGFLACGAEGDTQDDFVWEDANAAQDTAEAAAPGAGDEPSEIGSLKSALISQGVSGPDGGGCTVTGGVNKGKRGKFEDGWCCGPTFCTECTQDGTDNGKCRAGKLVSVLDTTLNVGSLDSFALAQ